MKSRFLAAAVSATALCFAVPGHALAAPVPVDYVRVCDAYGSGYFYIPGTETCLKLGGYIRYQPSWIDNTQSLGGGTAVHGSGGPSNERFNGAFRDWIRRDGVGVGFRTSGDYGDTKIGKFPLVGAYFDYEGAWGNQGYNEKSEVGTGDVTGVGFTFFRQDSTYGTGVIATTNGYGLDSTGTLDNNWHRVNLGLKVSLPCLPDEELEDGLRGIRVRGRIGLFYETLNTDASGKADLTLGGVPVTGYYQNYDLSAKDRYLGVRLGTHISLPSKLDGRWRSSINTDLYLGYHTGEGQFSQHTGVGIDTVNQSENYSKNGFAIGAGISFGTSYKFARGWSLGGNLELSFLPQVTSLTTAQNPSGLSDAGFSSQNATRIIGSIRITRSF